MIELQERLYAATRADRWRRAAPGAFFIFRASTSWKFPRQKIAAPVAPSAHCRDYVAYGRDPPGRRIPLLPHQPQLHHHMNKALSIVFLVAGIIALIYGINASHSVASHISNAATGTPTDHSMWLIILGIVGIIIGGFGALRRSN